jgi:hypothetical protein
VDVGLDQPAQREVLAERPGHEVPREQPLPVRAVLGRVGADRLVGATVDGQVGLLVAGEPVGAELEAPGHRGLDDRRAHRAPAPPQAGGQADVDGDDLAAQRGRHDRAWRLGGGSFS